MERVEELGEGRSDDVLRGCEAEGEDAPGKGDPPRLLEEFHGVEPIELGRHRVRKVDDEHIVPRFRGLDVFAAIGMDEANPGVIQGPDRFPGEDSPSHGDELGVKFDVVHLGDRGMFQYLGQGTRNAAPYQEDPLGFRVLEQGEMDRFLRREQIGVGEHPQAIFIETRLSL